MNSEIFTYAELPVQPSEVDGYFSVMSDSRLPRIRRRALLAKFFLILIPILTIGAFFVQQWPEWMSDIEKISPIGTDWMLLAVMLLAFGLTASCFKYTFGGWQQAHQRIWYEVQDSNIAVIAQHLCHSLSPGGTWQWFRPLNWSDGYLVVLGGHTLVIVNLTTDWMGYAFPGSVTEVHYNGRRIGSVSESRTHAQTYGGGHYAYATQTTAQTSGYTQDFYEHIVDLYSNMPGNEHLCAQFGGNEALAKEAYAALLPLTQMGN